MILGDSLQVMASLAEREGLRGKVQCIYFDPPYGIKFNSNWQVSTRSRDVKDGKLDQITREPEQVKAFRDTWKDGIHSYLTYLRDRLTAMRDLLTESGSIFVQIGDENVHRVRALMDEVFGEENFCALIQVQKTGGQASALLASTVDFVIWYARSKSVVKYRQLYSDRRQGHTSLDRYDQVLFVDGTRRRLSKGEIEKRSIVDGGVFCREQSLISAGRSASDQSVRIDGRTFEPRGNSHWKTTVGGIERLVRANRVSVGPSTISYIRTVDDFPIVPIHDRWEGLQIGQGLNYIVETSPKVLERLILLATDPGDLVLDPTCGSGTTAYVAEQWGRRWITIDTSRVSLALARARLMGARYPYYLLADSDDGRLKEAELTGKAPPDTRSRGDIHQGFVYERAPHITLKSVANNAEIDVVWENYQAKLGPLRREMNAALGKAWEEWEIPREAAAGWSDNAKDLHRNWWEFRITRQQE